MSVQIHPQVILSIADHHTRCAVQSNGVARVSGALLGTRSEQRVEIVHSLEINANREEPTNHGALSVSEADFRGDLELFKQVFPDVELLGWYATGALDAAVQDFHLKIVSQWTPSPLLLLLDAAAPADSVELPIKMLTGTSFVPTLFALQSDTTEQIIVDHMANIIQIQQHQGAPAAAPYAATLKVVQALQQRILILINYLESVVSDPNTADLDLLRDIQGIINRLPVMNSPAFRLEYQSEQNFAALVSVMTSLTTGEADLHELIDKYNVSFSKNRTNFGSSRFDPRRD